jgi:hypothetical protein
VEPMAKIVNRIRITRDCFNILYMHLHLVDGKDEIIQIGFTPHSEFTENLYSRTRLIARRTARFHGYTVPAHLPVEMEF